MVDGRYTDEERREIAAAAPGGTLSDEDVRALESAVRQYLDETQTRQRMSGSADKRTHWIEIEKQTRKLLSTIETVDHWIAPIWGSDGEPDHHGQRKDFVLRLREMISLARQNAADYGENAKKYARRQNPPRERLYDELFRVWTKSLGQDLSYSGAGPIVRFFDAVLGPVLGEEKPAPGTIGDAIDRYEQCLSLVEAGSR